MWKYKVFINKQIHNKNNNTTDIIVYVQTIRKLEQEKKVQDRYVSKNMLTYLYKKRTENAKCA